jgi:hypothetical protein
MNLDEFLPWFAQVFTKVVVSTRYVPNYILLTIGDY